MLIINFDLRAELGIMEMISLFFFFFCEKVMISLSSHASWSYWFCIMILWFLNNLTTDNNCNVSAEAKVCSLWSTFKQLTKHQVCLYLWWQQKMLGKYSINTYIHVVCLFFLDSLLMHIFGKKEKKWCDVKHRVTLNLISLLCPQYIPCWETFAYRQLIFVNALLKTLDLSDIQLVVFTIQRWG